VARGSAHQLEIIPLIKYGEFSPSPLRSGALSPKLALIALNNSAVIFVLVGKELSWRYLIRAVFDFCPHSPSTLPMSYPAALRCDCRSSAYTLSLTS